MKPSDGRRQGDSQNQLNEYLEGQRDFCRSKQPHPEQDTDHMIEVKALGDASIEPDNRKIENAEPGCGHLIRDQHYNDR